MDNFFLVKSHLKLHNRTKLLLFTRRRHSFLATMSLLHFTATCRGNEKREGKNLWVILTNSLSIIIIINFELVTAPSQWKKFAFHPRIILKWLCRPHHRSHYDEHRRRSAATDSTDRVPQPSHQRSFYWPQTLGSRTITGTTTPLYAIHQPQCILQVVSYVLLAGVSSPLLHVSRPVDWLTLCKYAERTLLRNCSYKLSRVGVCM